MTKYVIGLLGLIPLLSYADYAKGMSRLSFGEVIELADKSGRRTCYEIFNYGAVFGLCDAVTGKTQLVSLQENRIIPLLAAQSLDDVFKISQGVSIKYDSADAGVSARYFLAEEGSSRDAVAMRIPWNTTEVDVRGLVSGEVSIRHKVDDEVLVTSSVSYQLGDRIVFKVDSADGWELLFRPENGRIQFDEIWVK